MPQRRHPGHEPPVHLDDLRGEFLPLYSQTAEHSWYQPFVIYLTALVLKVVHLSEWAVRLPTVGIGIFQLPGSNALSSAQGVLVELDDASKSFPRGMTYQVPYNPTEYISKSISAAGRSPSASRW